MTGHWRFRRSMYGVDSHLRTVRVRKCQQNHNIQPKRSQVSGNQIGITELHELGFDALDCVSAACYFLHQESLIFSNLQLDPESSAHILPVIIYRSC